MTDYTGVWVSSYTIDESVFLWIPPVYSFINLKYKSYRAKGFKSENVTPSASFYFPETGGTQ